MHLAKIQKFIDVLAASNLSPEADRFLHEFINLTELYKGALSDHPSGCTLKGEIYLEWELSRLTLLEISEIYIKSLANEGYIGILHQPDRFFPYYWMMLEDSGFKIILNTCLVPLFIYTGQEYQEIDQMDILTKLNNEN